MTRASAPRTTPDSRNSVHFARPANGNDVLSMIGVLQSYGLLTGDHFMIARNFLEMEARNSLVAVGKGGGILSFGIKDRHIDIPEKNAVILIYNDQIRPSPQHVSRLVRGFALGALATRGRDGNPRLSLMADWNDAMTRGALENLGAKPLAEKPIRTLVGERLLTLCEIDGLADKFTRAPAGNARPCARIP